MNSLLEIVLMVVFTFLSLLSIGMIFLVKEGVSKRAKSIFTGFALISTVGLVSILYYNYQEISPEQYKLILNNRHIKEAAKKIVQKNGKITVFYFNKLSVEMKSEEKKDLLLKTYTKEQTAVSPKRIPAGTKFILTSGVCPTGFAPSSLQNGLDVLIPAGTLLLADPEQKNSFVLCAKDGEKVGFLPPPK